MLEKYTTSQYQSQKYPDLYVNVIALKALLNFHAFVYKMFLDVTK